MYGYRKKLFRRKEAPVSSILPWSHIVNHQKYDCPEGIVVQKDGNLQATIAYRGPDTDSDPASEINALCDRYNEYLMRLGAGWGDMFESQRYSRTDYPGAKFRNVAGFLFDTERKHQFSQYGEYYDNCYYHTIVYRLPRETSSKVSSWFWSLDDDDSNGIFRDHIHYFSGHVRNLLNMAKANMPMAELLDSHQTLSYLRSGVTFKWHQMQHPDTPFFLDFLLADTAIENTIPLKVGDNYVEIITINSFPSKTVPALLDELNKANIEYRFVTRFIHVDNDAADKEINSYSNMFYGNRKSAQQSAQNAMSPGSASDQENSGAKALEDDTNLARANLALGHYGFGFYNAQVIVFHPDIKELQKRSEHIQIIVSQARFGCFVEKWHALDTFVGCMPGDMVAGIRRFFLSTINTAHMLPLSATWSGARHNLHFKALTGIDTPLMMCATNTATPYFFNTNYLDNLHTAVLGPTRAGKSTLLQAMQASDLKYEPHMCTVIFDIGDSARLLTMAVGGDYYDVGSLLVNFSPLRELETESDLLWAVDFIDLLLECQKITPTIDMNDEILIALRELQSLSDPARRTLSIFSGMVQNDIIKTAIKPYTISGKFSTLFDSTNTNFEFGNWTMFELRSLMEMGQDALKPVLAILFHKLEQKVYRDKDKMISKIYMDEIWVALGDQYFTKFIKKALKTWPKLNAGIIFASQDPADVAASEIATTIVQQCQTKIYLPDPEAKNSLMYSMYKKFGLRDSEINVIARAQKKQDYFYKSDLGSRLFQLDLGPLQLALIEGKDYKEFMDFLQQNIPKNEWLWEILREKKIEHVKELKDYIQSLDELSTIDEGVLKF